MKYWIAICFGMIIGVVYGLGKTTYAAESVLEGYAENVAGRIPTASAGGSGGGTGGVIGQVFSIAAGLFGL